jgi:hypothetical protein
MDDRKPNPNFNLEQHLVEVAQREDALAAEVKERLPDFVAYCHSQVNTIILHQDAFAVGYQEDELRLLGMAIKYAGINGKEVRIVGSNRDTV